MAEVDITLPDGGAATVAEQDLQQALNAGAVVGAPRGAPEHDDAGSKAMAFITAADENFGGIGTSLGLAANEALNDTASSDAAAREIRGMRADNQGYALAGGALGGLAMPGLGLELGAESALGRVATTAAEGAIEGGIAGAGHALTEDALGNPETNGDLYFSGEVANGLLLGGALGGALGGLGEGARVGLGALSRELGGTRAAGRELMSGYRAAQNGVDGVMARGMRSDEAAKLVDEAGQLGRQAGLGDATAGRAFDAYSGIIAKGDPETAALLRTQFKDGASLAAKTETRLDDMAREVASPFDSLIKSEDALYDASITAKPEAMRKLVDPSKLVEAHDTAIDVIRQARDFLVPFEQSSNKLNAEGFANAFRKQVDEAERIITGSARKATAAEERAAEKLAAAEQDLATASQARVQPHELYALQKARDEAQEAVNKVGVPTAGGKPAHPADVFIALDNLKRNVGKLQRTIGQADGSVKGAFERFYADALQAPLENASVWGEAAASAQREVNQTWTQRLATRDKVGEYFTTSFGKDGFDRLERVDPSKLKGFFRNVTGAENDLKREALEAHLATLMNAFDATEKHYGKQAAFTEGRAAVARMQKALGKATDEAKIIEKLNTQRLAEGDGLGGVLGMASDVFTRPLKTAERLASVRNGIDKMTTGIKKSVDAVFGGGAGAAAKPMPKAEVLERAAEVRRLAANPDALADRLAKRIGGLASAAPNHAAAVNVAAARAITHLAQHAPIGTTSGTMFGKKEKRYTDTEVDSFGRRLQAFEDPQSTVQLAISGKLQRDHVDTLKALHPAVYEQVRENTMRHFESLERAGKLNTVPYAKQLAIGILLDIPVNDTMDPSFVQLLQSMKAPATGSNQQSPPPPQGKTIPRRVDIDRTSMTTESERIEGGGTP